MDVRNLLRKIYWVTEWNYLGFLVHNTYGMDTKVENNNLIIKATRKMRNPFNGTITERPLVEFDTYFVEKMDKVAQFFDFTYKVVKSSTNNINGSFNTLLQEYTVVIEITSIGEHTKVSGNPLFLEGDDENYVHWVQQRFVDKKEYICW